MKKIYTLTLMIILLLITGVLGEAENNNGSVSRRDAFIKALTGIKMAYSEVTLDFIDKPDEFRLNIIDHCLKNPLEITDTLENITNFLTERPNGDLDLLLRCYRLLDFPTKKPEIAKESRDYPWAGVVSLPNKIKTSLNLIYDSFERSEKDLEEVFAKIDSFQLDSLYRFSPSLLLENEGQFDKRQESTLEELDDYAQEAAFLTNRIFSIISSVERSELTRISLDIFYSTLQAKSALEGLSVGESFSQNGTIEHPGVEGDVLFFESTRFGLVVVGGPQKTIYRVPAAIIIDLGGDDEYYYNAGGTVDSMNFAVALDLSGNDLYKSTRNFAFGAGHLGAGILIDVNGQDIYKTQNLALGSAVLGTGILLDYQGADCYYSSIASQGSGFAGCGILADMEGMDYYRAQLKSQGFGFVAGLGLLLDQSGNDAYLIQPAFSDESRQDQYFISMSHGFGYGTRPDYSGGIGFLLDQNGDDRYLSDIFGQGAGYWFALGALIDQNGNDSYTAFQFAQGSGSYFGGGILIDEDGSDSYLSRGVSQGCGHEQGLGYLLDKNGDDNYVIWDYSQGAGNANGIGIFVDEQGDDGYLVKKDQNSQGYGNFRREYGSIGIFLDLRGHDIYSGRGKNSSWWSAGKYGIAIDFPAKLEVSKKE
ncbi:hypothetical protein JW877_08435 [bacterium]|nr:hypothetical protein [bacterium]